MDSQVMTLDERMTVTEAAAAKAAEMLATQRPGRRGYSSICKIRRL